MDGKVCLVTGATDGIGWATALGLAQLGAQVVVAGRNPAKGAAAVARIQAESGNPRVENLNADLSSLAEVRRLAAAFLARYDRLDVLINNAGAAFLRRRLSIDGIEMTLAVNHLAYFLLTHLLLEVLQDSAPARVVNVSSSAHYGSPLDFGDLQNRKRYWVLRAYGRSKFANVLFTYELARRLEGTGVTANALHPGWIATNIGRNNGLLVRLLMPIIQYRALSAEEGAQTTIFLASSPEVEGMTGRFFINKKAVPSDPASYDERAAEQLWERSIKLAGLEK